MSESLNVSETPYPISVLANCSLAPATSKYFQFPRGFPTIPEGRGKGTPGYMACQQLSFCRQVRFYSQLVEGPSPQGPSLFHQGLTISMTLISNGWLRRLAVSLQLWIWASWSLPSYLLSGLLCCPGWTLLPVFMASSGVHCPGHDPTLSCFILLKWFTFSPHS